MAEEVGRPRAWSTRTSPRWTARNWNDPFVQGKGGIIIDVNVRGTDLLDLFKEKDPKDFDKVAMVGNLKRSDGQKFSLPFTGYNDVLAISKQRIRTEEQLDEVLQTLDKLQSKEGSILLTNGIEGRNYKARDGKYAVLINQDDPQGQDDPERRGQGLHPARHPGQRRARRRTRPSSPTEAAAEAVRAAATR